MDEEDFYATGTETADAEGGETDAAHPVPKLKHEDEDLEEGEEEDDDEDGSDSDIDIITERKDGSKPAPTTQPRYNEIRNIPQRTTSSDASVKPAVKKEGKNKDTSGVSSAGLPGLSTSKIDVDAKPIYEPAGKPITQVNIEEDLDFGENGKPWLRSGTDVTDYFNYGFVEWTWNLYASKQETLRSQYDEQKMVQQMEGMHAMLGLPSLPGMPGMPAGAGGVEGIPPEMMAFMQQMAASGIDPSQMNPAMMFGAFPDGQAGGGGAGGAQASNQGQGFGNQGAFLQGQNQQMDYGYGQGNNRGGGGNYGRGRGRGRNW